LTNSDVLFELFGVSTTLRFQRRNGTVGLWAPRRLNDGQYSRYPYIKAFVRMSTQQRCKYTRAPRTSEYTRFQPKIHAPAENERVYALLVENTRIFNRDVGSGDLRKLIALQNCFLYRFIAVIYYYYY